VLNITGPSFSFNHPPSPQKLISLRGEMLYHRHFDCQKWQYYKIKSSKFSCRISRTQHLATKPKYQIIKNCKAKLTHKILLIVDVYSRPTKTHRIDSVKWDIPSHTQCPHCIEWSEETVLYLKWSQVVLPATSPGLPNSRLTG